MKKRALLLAVIMLLSHCFCIGVVAEEDKISYLMFNDELWGDAELYPAREFYNLWYVPLGFFDNFDSLKVKKTDKKIYGSFIISSSDESRYMSFNVDDKTVMCSDGVNYAVASFIYSKQRYIPLNDICGFFGLRLEITSDEAYIRISDGSQSLTLSQAVENAKQKDTTQPAPDTTAPDDGKSTIDSSLPVIHEQKKVYIMINADLGGRVNRMLDALYLEDITATFFVSYSDIHLYYDQLLRIVSEGHGIGFLVDGTLSAEQLAQRLEEQNKELYGMIRQTTRLVRISGGTENADTLKSALTALGYAVCEPYVDGGAAGGDSWDIAPRIVSSLDSAARPITELYINETTIATVTRMGTYMSQKPHLHTVRMTEADRAS